MTEKELSRITNTELSNHLNKASEYIEEAVNGMPDITGFGRDSVMFYVHLMKEASRRLKIPYHITFEDEAFDM